LINKNRLISSFIKYVKIDSLSRKEARFMKVIKKELSDMGIRSTQDNAGKHIGGDCGNLYAFVKGTVKGAPRILLNAHVDTVMPGENIKPRIKNGVIFSDGTTILGADNKAGVAVIMEVLRTIRSNKMPHGDLDILFTVSEETGLTGSKYVDRKFLKADFGYVMDGGEPDEIINRAPSQDSLDIKILGRAAHAGVHPEDGINAIKVASVAIANMKLGRLDHETTANIGLIKGGVATNIVPETVHIRGEARSHDINKLKRQVKHMVSVLRKACAKFKAELICKVTPSYRSFNIPKTNKFLALAVKAAKKTGLKPVVKPTGGGSDANIFAYMGLSCLILGAGADNVHTKKENVAVDDMAAGAELLMNIIKESII
jgi:tripeptide aminopeptidase